MSRRPVNASDDTEARRGVLADLAARRAYEWLHETAVTASDAHDALAFVVGAVEGFLQFLWEIRGPDDTAGTVIARVTQMAEITIGDLAADAGTTVQ